MTGFADVCFVDCETTGLDADRHQIWEVGLITPDGAERVWQFPIDEVAADPFALDVGHYWDRRWPTDYVAADYTEPAARAVVPSEGWCRHFRDLTAGCHLAGAVVSFDEERLRRLLRANGVLHRWHYHLVDVEALAAGRLGMRPPWDSDALSRAVGIDPDRFDRHTALGDARWAMAVYGAVMGEASR